MDKKELMIGDWVFDDETKSRMQIEDILCNGVNGEWDGQECYGVTRFENIKPIPVTEEMFERNGWRHDRKWNSESENRIFVLNYSVWRKSGEGTNIRICFWENNKRSLRIVKPGADFIEIPIAYVHELQHALRLCGFGDLADGLKVE